MSKKPSKREKEMYIGYNELMSFYKTLGISVFNWNGLPDNIRPFYPESTLFDQGIACMVPLPGTGEVDIFPVAYNSIEIDLHGYPTSWRAYPVGSSAGADILRNQTFTEEDSVLIWNNPERTGSRPYIDLQVKNMLIADNTIRTNTLVQNTPIWLRADTKNALTAKNLANEFMINPFIFSTDIAKDDVSFEATVLNVPFIGDKLSDQYETYNNRILRYLGIKHLPVEKQERMLTGEASANDDMLEMVVKTKLDCRNRACEQIKEVFGIDVSVELYSDAIEQRNMERMQSTFGDGSKNNDTGESSGSKQQKD